MWRHIRNFSILGVIALIGAGWYVTRPDVARVPVEKLTGPTPEIGEAREEWIPTIKVAKADPWKAGEAPKAAEGLTVERFAEGLDHPRNLYVLPNGDVLVAETNSPPGHRVTA
jgi:glucose/arabinose dehydrogenase